MNQLTTNYLQMKKIVRRYHESASTNSVPAKWCVMGIAEWLDGFENQVQKLNENEPAKIIILEDLENERKKLIQLRVRAIVGGARFYDLGEGQ